MVSHFEMEGTMRYKQLRNYTNRRNIKLDEFGTLGMDLTHKHDGDGSENVI